MKKYWVKFEAMPGYRIEVFVEAASDDAARYTASFRLGMRFGSELDVDQFKWLETKKVTE